MNEKLLTIGELAAISGKTREAIRRTVYRKRIEQVSWFTKPEALALGLRWGKGNGGGRAGKRPYISVSDPAVQALIDRNRQAAPVSSSRKRPAALPDREGNGLSSSTLLLSVISTIDAEIGHLTSLKKTLMAKRRLLTQLLKRSTAGGKPGK